MPFAPPPSSVDPVAALRELEAHRVCTPELLSLSPITPTQLAALKREQGTAHTAAAITAMQTTPGWQSAHDLVQALGRARCVPAAPLLGRIWRYSQIDWMRAAAGHALFDIDTPEAHTLLQSALLDAEPHGELPTFLAIKSMVATAPESAFDRISHYFDDTGADASLVARTALRFFGPHSYTHEGREWVLPTIPALLRSDGRWVRTALRLRRHPEIGAGARSLLRSLTKEEVDAALAEHPDPPPPPPVIYKGPRDLVARYTRGEHDDVWRWLRAAGPIVDPSLREEALAVATAAMRRVRANVEMITERLEEGDYPFDDFLPPWAAPTADTEKEIARIEEAVGGPVPLTLRAFWRTVGSVSWKYTEDDEADGTWCGLPVREADPLVVYPTDGAWSSVEEWREQLTESHAAAVGPAVLELAPDYLHKANISGGAPYGFSVPNGEVDAVFEEEAHGLPFIEYLRLCFWWGGFPRLEGVEIGGEGRRTLEGLRLGLERF